VFGETFSVFSALAVARAETHIYSGWWMKLGSMLCGRQASAWREAMATITLVYVVGMALIWFGPDTKGRPLPE
jgi:hypothetical protein